MTKFKKTGNGYAVIKHGVQVALIRKAGPGETSEWGNWLLESAGGRIDRHQGLQDAKSDALKL